MGGVGRVALPKTNSCRRSRTSQAPPSSGQVSAGVCFADKKNYSTTPRSPFANTQFGRVQIKTSPTVARTAININTLLDHDKQTTATIISVARSFAFLLIAPRCSQSSISERKIGFLRSQRFSRGEPREKKNDASKTKGVVGNSGSSIPNNASSKNTQPNSKHTERLIATSSKPLP